MGQLSALLLVLAATAAPAEEQSSFFRLGNFRVFRHDQDQICRMVTAFERRDVGLVSLSVTYNARKSEVLLTTLTAVSTSLADEGSLRLRMVFLKGQDATDESWGDRKFKYSKSREGHRIFSTTVSGSADVDRIMRDLTKSSHIAFFYNDRVVTSFSLAGSSKVVPKLEECAFQAAGLNPHDPFRP